jgi:hypothetical protein
MLKSYVMKYVVLKNMANLNHERKNKLNNPNTLEKDIPTKLARLKNTCLAMGR